mmetsp:Transcript_5100/g.8367  ORF Transcript_5100/g.8367 Transcript_5100/m.8367 type:complete len:206 (+) Transcript_5100:233-850(+)
MGSGIVVVKFDLIVVTLVDDSVALDAVLVPPSQVFFEAGDGGIVPLKDTNNELLAKNGLGGGNVLGLDDCTLIQIQEGASHEVIQHLFRVNVIIDGHGSKLGIKVRVPCGGLTVVEHIDFSLDWVTKHNHETTSVSGRHDTTSVVDTRSDDNISKAVSNNVLASNHGHSCGIHGIDIQIFSLVVIVGNNLDRWSSWDFFAAGVTL